MFRSFGAATEIMLSPFFKLDFAATDKEMLTTWSIEDSCYDYRHGEDRLYMMALDYSRTCMLKEESYWYNTLLNRKSTKLPKHRRNMCEIKRTSNKTCCPILNRLKSLNKIFRQAIEKSCCPLQYLRHLYNNSVFYALYTVDRSIRINNCSYRTQT